MTERTPTLPLFRAAMNNGRISTVLWSAGILAAISLYLPLYPSIGGANSQMARLIAELPKQLVATIGYTDIATGAGYAGATFYGLAGFAIIVIAATAWGTGTTASAEEDGELVLVLAHGVSRTRVVLEGTLATAVRLVWLVTLSGAAVWALNDPAQLELRAANVTAVSAAFLGLGLISAAAAIAAGAILGRRTPAISAGAGVAVIAYILNALGSQSATLQWLRTLSPYGWAYQHRPLATGVDWGGLALLYGLALTLIVVAVVGFNRRDVGR
ncbi:ABC transporter permease subunit [Curtobacterium sp. PhB115]|uniref:ABC transporter permease subunit n=1 Tax=Curtobacterium sp. PhB115 TaxID=2485173 RepID=UPI000F4C5E22|nr:ABC transporter permease subunit [Curtobacterium sp. PhB115]ROP58656.1 ABC-2 type transport system permease protein [Curtobacterium sp. PhB115]